MGGADSPKCRILELRSLRAPYPAQEIWRATKHVGLDGPRTAGSGVATRAPSTQLQQVVHAADDVFHGIQPFVGNFGGDPAGVTDIAEGGSDGRPVDFSLAQAIGEPL